MPRIGGNGKFPCNTTTIISSLTYFCLSLQLKESMDEGETEEEDDYEEDYGSGSESDGSKEDQ